MHLQLITNPVSVSKREQALCKLIVRWVHRFVVDDLLLLHGVTVQNALPLGCRGVGPLNWELASYLVYLASGLDWNADVNFWNIFSPFLTRHRSFWLLFSAIFAGHREVFI